MRLEGKVAIVTGAAHGIGRAIALELASQGAGVLVADIQGDKVAAMARDLGRKGTEVVGYDAVDNRQVTPMEEGIRLALGRFRQLQAAGRPVSSLGQ